MKRKTLQIIIDDVPMSGDLRKDLEQLDQNRMIIQIYGRLLN